MQSYRSVVEEFAQESGADMADVAAALASLAQGKTPLFLSNKRGTEAPPERGETRFDRGADDRGAERPARHAIRSRSRDDPQDTYRLAVGSVHGVQAGNIVGAIANEAGLDGSDINGIDIQHDHSFVRLPEGMPPAMLKRLQKVRVKGELLQLTMVENRQGARERPHGGKRPR
jgi:ATP-dependent RNA helicase DeaD